MLVEFFCAPLLQTRLFAIVGGLLLASHSIYSAILARWFVEWQGRFYDGVGDAAKVLAVANNANATQTTLSAVDDAIYEGSEQVKALLSQFASIVMPMAFIHPVNRFIRRRYTFAWRMTLMGHYTNRWAQLQQTQLEGISQRIQEDTQRFGRGLETCVSEILDAFMTLVVFTPALIDLGGHVVPKGKIEVLSTLFGKGWLLALAFILASIGWAISLLVAHRLVDLEVRNQIVEAEFRKQLVLTEVRGVTPAATTDVDCDLIAPTSPAILNNSTETTNHVASVITFEESFGQLHTNYTALFRSFFFFDAWTSVFDQAMIILPYALVAPMLFRRADAVSLGTLVKVASTFGRVFGALSLPAFNWASVNDFRSVLRRLGTMETILGMKLPRQQATTDTSTSSTSTTHHGETKSNGNSCVTCFARIVRSVSSTHHILGIQTADLDTLRSIHDVPSTDLKYTS